MKKIKLRSIILLLLVAAVGAVAYARMSDAEVMAYIEKRIAEGRTEKQIGEELAARGVTPQQIQRIQAQYENDAAPVVQRTGRGPDKVVVDDSSREHTSTEQIKVGDFDAVNVSVGEGAKRQIYGHNVFNENNLTFAPGQNLATPQNYILGPGDEVVIDIWGENEEHVRQEISPEGTIMIAQLGPIHLSGNTISQANNIVRDRFARKFAGVGANRSDVNVSLGQTRSITVDIMGEVAAPGTFRLSPFATVFHALYNAGGINDIGSLRNIEVLRNGKKVSNVDIYDYLFRGKQTGNIRLQEGDVIIVPPYTELVHVEGNIKRPMYYEIRPGETLQSLLDYAGGFTGGAYSDMVRLTRRNGREKNLTNVNRADYASTRLKDGDEVSVGAILDRYDNRVEVQGAVFRPGSFAIGTDIFTVRDLIEKADGLTNDAYTSRVILYREAPDLSLEVEAFDLGALLAGAIPDIELRRNDILVISRVQELFGQGVVGIQGFVNKPGEYNYAANMTLEDLILLAGGLELGASTARVDIARRIMDPTSTSPTDSIATTLSVSIENGLLMDDGKGFELKPYDVVTIFRSPGYVRQEFVDVSGEVVFNGPYALSNRGERLTDIIQRAGGLTEFAYVRGASLTRRYSDDEKAARAETMRLAWQSSGNDSIPLTRLNFSDTYTVGIHLDKALANPGSDYDVILRAGDRLHIPEYYSTVSVDGEVIYPNTITFTKGAKVKDYIKQAGGYTANANKGRAFVIYMNGTVAKAGRRTKLEPGCKIIVPSKKITKKSSLPEVMAYISSFTSLGVMAASIASLLRK